MNRFERPNLYLVLVALLAAALTLGGCGRKGGLDPPPASSASGPVDTSSGPTPQGPKKHIPLDVLLD